MPGRDHHFVPQLLQRGFSSGKTRKGHDQVWVFRRGQKAFRTNTRNQFVERDFYGPPAGAVVDRLITDEENRLSRFVAYVRSVTGPMCIGASDDATDFVLQISLRVRWVRKFMETGIELMLDRTAEVVGDKASATRLYEHWLENNPGWLLGALLSEASKRLGRSLSAEEKGQISMLASLLESNPDKLAELSDFNFVVEAKGELRAAMCDATEQGHLQGLEGSLRSRQTKYRRFLELMKWSIVVIDPPSLILGDCGPLYLDGAGVPLGPVGVPLHEEVRAVALPISTSHVLVGKRGDACPDPGPEVLKEALAAWSSEAFIAAANTPRNQELHQVINSRVGPFFEVTVREVLAENGL